MSCSTASTTSLSAAEAYALWCERVRVLFGTAPFDADAWLLASGTHSDYEDVFRAHTSAAVDATHDNNNNDDDDDNDATNTTTRTTAAALDEARFPCCFYARMLRGARAPSRVAAASDDNGDDDKDDALVAQELAWRLRQHTRQARQRGAYTRRGDEQHDDDDDDAVVSYRDVRVAAQQAQLHSELTEMLLTLRRHNAAAHALRACLARSRALSLSTPHQAAAS